LPLEKKNSFVLYLKKRRIICIFTVEFSIFRISLACMHKVLIVEVRMSCLMCERGFSSGWKGNKSLTRTSDAVRHEARPVDTPRFVASHPRCRVFYLPRIQLSRGSCSNDRRRFRFIFRHPAPRCIGCRVTDLVNDLMRWSILPGTFEVWPVGKQSRDASTRMSSWKKIRADADGTRRDKRGFFVLIYARRSFGHY